MYSWDTPDEKECSSLPLRASADNYNEIAIYANIDLLMRNIKSLEDVVRDDHYLCHIDCQITIQVHVQATVQG